MILRGIKLSNYRNLDDIKVIFSDDINYIVGENNVGKSNLLYSINRVFSGKNFESSDFHDISKPIEIVLRLLLTDLEKGMFDDLIDPKDTDYINVRVIQDNPDEYLKYSHYESSEVISLADIRKLLLINYDSLRNPKNELDFSKTKGAGSFLNFIVKRFIECQVEGTSFLNKNAVKKLERYTTSILSNIAVFDRFRIQPLVENNNQEMLTRIMVLKDSNSIGISEIGYGVQYNMLIVLSILEKIITYAKKMQNDEDKQLQTLLVFDEPEIHLHPYLQRTIMKDILKIASGEDVEFNSILHELFGIKNFRGQIIVATHSPNIIGDDYLKLIRLYSEHGSTDVVNTRNLSLNQSEKKQLMMQFEYIKEAIFARGVIIVEGESEYGSFKLFGNTMGIDFDREAIALIKAGGAESIIPLMKLFDKLKIESVGVMDKDKKIEKNIPAQENLFFTTQLCFDSEIVYRMIKCGREDVLEKILTDYDSKGTERYMQASALNKAIDKFKIKNIKADKGYKFSELSINEKMYPVLYITWFSVNKGIILGKIIGQNIDKKMIPACYARAIRKIIERTV
ncbi:DNA replication and repair protein RecF [Anaerotignum neopropionicum]|uniref:DNA replication and repair protein RecF n=1 Tax=Anaerotignum neopropionicum TaxID=36847 RepID=A0A136WHN5_9FIRM|nr:AAA family ATPase [Anaerotignum neopropionicum]KXL53890.1 DNA replication and repair protein RecF [Anaerotignum neopropionicum]